MFDLNAFVAALHQTPFQAVISFAGAGSQALAWLHGVAGSSRTVLEATDHYSTTSISSLIGRIPVQFTSPEVASAMAAQAYLRACELTSPTYPKIGVGCTATITTDRNKRGEHRVCISAWSATKIHSYKLIMRKGERSRRAEEELVSLLLLSALAAASGLPATPLPLLAGEKVETVQQDSDLISRLLAGNYELLRALPDGNYVPVRVLPGQVLLSGAFNPLHQGHRTLAQVVRKRLGRPVVFEMPLINADKAPIDAIEADHRAVQFMTDGAEELLLTRAPLFHQKARLFPHSVFVIGVDTAARLVQPRFYQGDHVGMLAALTEIRTAGCRFLVAGRLQGNHFLTLPDLNIPEGFREIFEAVPEEVFRQDISSTQLRISD